MWAAAGHGPRPQRLQIQALPKGKTRLELYTQAMCLFIFTHLNECAAGIGKCLEGCAKDMGGLMRSCGKDLASCLKSLLGFLLLLPGIVLGAALVTAVALIVAVLKLLMGTVVKVDKALRDYCGVIQRGVNAYQGTDGGVAVGVPVAAAMAREQIPVQVPLGVGPGTTLSIEHPRGAVSVVVPQGVPPGGTFLVELAPAVGLPVAPERPWFFRAADSCCASCLAELYCCCAPLYLLSLVRLAFTTTASSCSAPAGRTPHEHMC